MISFSQATEIHSLLIKEFGGASGIRDANGLASALARPYQTFDMKPLYPSAIEKASCLIESILSNHPFIDGK